MNFTSYFTKLKGCKLTPNIVAFVMVSNNYFLKEPIKIIPFIIFL
jgi:hypothetical protein